MITRCCYDLFHGDSLSGLSYNSDIALFQEAYDAGWIAMIHKLSQGAGFVDPRGVGRLRAAAQVPGKLLGGYHFMTLSDPVAAQVGNFLHAAGRVGVPLLLVLDFETIPSGEAEAMASEFVNALRLKSGVWPVLYSGRWEITPTALDNLPACPLWLAEYGTRPIPPPGWTDWVLHQYSDGRVGPGPVDIPGIGFVDQSEFAGTLDELRAWWMKQVVL
jgi:lysozyme